MLFSLRTFPRETTPPWVLNIPTYRQVLPHLAAEVRRARRFEHPLAILVLSPETTIHPNTNGKARGRAGQGSSSLYALLGAFLRNTLREHDLLASAPESLLYAALLPETDDAGARRVIERTRDGFLGCVGVELRAASAEYPRDGLTVEDLFDCARACWSRGQAAGTSRVQERSHG